jgi:hypothetical protein
MSRDASSITLAEHRHADAGHGEPRRRSQAPAQSPPLPTLAGAGAKTDTRSRSRTMFRWAAAATALLVMCACDSPTRPDPVLELLSGVVTDAPMASPAAHAVSVASEGRLTATLSWDDVPSPQPAGRAELRLSVLDARGRTLVDTLDTPGGSPLEVSTGVVPGAHTLVVGPRFRDRIGFYCLCDVPYRLRVEHP